MLSEWSINQSINQLFNIYLNLTGQVDTQIYALIWIQANIVLCGKGGRCLATSAWQVITT